MSILRLSKRGDTLVEVLLAITIVSMVLGGAFALTRQSATTTQRAQERSEAINLAQQQTELLRAGVVEGKDYSTAASASEGFCVNKVDLEPLTGTNDCQFGISDGAQRRYRVRITGEDVDLYEIKVTWDRLGGGEQEVASWRYRVKHEPVTTASSGPSGGDFFPTPPPPTTPPPTTPPPTTPPPGGGGAECVNLREFSVSESVLGTLNSSVGPGDWLTQYTFNNVNLAACNYLVTLIGIETAHARHVPPQMNQNQERFFVEGYAADGTLTFRTRPTDDIPECSRTPITQESDPIEYARCTKIVNNVFINAEPLGLVTDRIVVKHIYLWQPTFQEGPAGVGLLCPPGVPNDACAGAAAAGGHNTIHGVSLEFRSL
jgi:type II secretory pathway pseudopilin PulG